MKIVSVGAGSMAEAMIKGWVGKQILKPEDITVMNRSDQDRLDYLKVEYGVEVLCREKQALQEADFVLLAVKPKDMETALTAIRTHLNPEAVLISVAAGVSIEAIQKHAGDIAVARAMPNTSASIGKSATGVAWSKAVTKDQQNKIMNLLSSIGSVIVVTEEELHPLTAVSGSGPAYLYFMAEAMTEAAVATGLSEQDAIRLVRETFSGAAAMMQTGDFKELRKNITSPNGTTAAGIAALEEYGFSEAVSHCIHQAAKRSRELGAQFS